MARINPTIILIILGIVLLGFFTNLFVIIGAQDEVGIFTWKPQSLPFETRWVYATQKLGERVIGGITRTAAVYQTTIDARPNQRLKACIQGERTSKLVRFDSHRLALILENIDLSQPTELTLNSRMSASGPSRDGGSVELQVGVVDLAITEEGGFSEAKSSTPGSVRFAEGSSLGMGGSFEITKVVSDGKTITTTNKIGTSTGQSKIDITGFENPRLYFWQNVDVDGAKNGNSCLEIPDIMIPDVTKVAFSELVPPTQEVQELISKAEPAPELSSWKSDFKEEPPKQFVDNVLELGFNKSSGSSQFSLKQNFENDKFIIFENPEIIMETVSFGGAVNSEAEINMLFGNVPVFSRKQRGEVSVVGDVEVSGAKTEDALRFPSGTIVIEQDFEKQIFRFTKDGGQTWSQFFPVSKPEVILSGRLGTSQAPGRLFLSFESIKTIPGVVDTTVKDSIESAVRKSAGSIRAEGDVSLVGRTTRLIKENPVVSVGILIVLFLILRNLFGGG